MGHNAAGLTLLGFVVAATAYALLAGYLMWRLRAGAAGEGRGPRLVLGAVLGSFAWSLAGVLDHLERALWITQVVSGLDLLRYALWLAVLWWLLRPTVPEGQERPLADRLGLFAAGLVVAVGCLLLLRIWQGQYRSDASRLFLQAWLGLPLIGLVLVEQVFRNIREDLRWLAKPVCLGLLCVFAFDVYLYAEAALLGELDKDVMAVRPLVHLAIVPMLGLATSRSANWASSMQVSRRAVFYSASLVLAGGYLLFLASIGYYVRYFGGDWGRALQLGLVFLGLVSLVSLTLSTSLRARVRVWITKHFFRYRYDYREEWLAFTSMLSSDSSPREVGALVVRALANIVECPAGSLWTRSDADAAFLQTACWNLPQISARVAGSDGLVAFLHSQGWIIDLDEHRQTPERYEGLNELPDWLLADERHWAVIPLPVGTELLGFVVLAKPRTALDLDWEVRDLLKTASRQAAGYLAQMRATEAMLEARKFEAFNRMSAFVVHDLKNIVTQLSLMLSNAQRLAGNPEFQQDMLETVESSLEKMKRLMLQLREGAAPPQGARGVALTPIAERLARATRTAGRQLEVRIGEPLSTRGHEDRLERVLGHLVQNALEATPPSGRVWLHVGRHSGQIKVEIGDTGQGMSEDFVRDKLFRPFSTTKHAGMGIGTYESAQYIRELGGSIDVSSILGEGTQIVVLLPLLDVQMSSDLSSTGRP